MTINDEYNLPLNNTSLSAKETAHSKRIYIETFGCQMNEYDSLMLRSLLVKEGHTFTDDIAQADWVLVNTCAVREHAQDRVYGRLRHIRQYTSPKTKVALLGCMAQNMQEKLFSLDRRVDVVAGPDSYRHLPEIITEADFTEPKLLTRLNRKEMYDGLPWPEVEGISAFITVMRGCDNFCSFCVVPFTRGRERSRNPYSILQEAEYLKEKGVKEITLLGQNVNSYSFQDEKGNYDFSFLLQLLADKSGLSRIRFTSPHPKDFPPRLIEVMSEHKEIMPQIHLPLQAGSNAVLKNMRRDYTIEQYFDLVGKIRSTIPDVFLSTDIIFGFPGESAQDAEQTIMAMRQIRFHSAFIFKYSPREHSVAAGMLDDVPEEEKSKRVTEAVSLQQEISLAWHQSMIGQKIEILIEKESKKNAFEWTGKSRWGHTVVFPRKDAQIGETVNVEITEVTSATLIGSIVE